MIDKIIDKYLDEEKGFELTNPGAGKKHYKVTVNKDGKEMTLHWYGKSEDEMKEKVKKFKNLGSLVSVKLAEKEKK